MNTKQLISNTDIKSTYVNFEDDIWDFTPFYKEETPYYKHKKIDFSEIVYMEMREVTKQYIFYKLGFTRIHTVMLNYLNVKRFAHFCQIKGLISFVQVDQPMLLSYALWLKMEYNLSETTGYAASWAVEEMIKVGQIKGWKVPKNDVLQGCRAKDLWKPLTDRKKNRTKPIPDDIFDKIVSEALTYKEYHRNDVLTKCGILIQSQTGLRIGEVLSIKSGCLHQNDSGTYYFDVEISKTAKGEPITHQVFANELVVNAIRELEDSTRGLRNESGYQYLFLTRNSSGITVPKTSSWSGGRLRTFIKRCDIRDHDGNLYPLKSHQFRATFVKQLIMKNIPITYVMKQFAHVSVEMTSHYLTLQETEVKEVYARMLLAPDAKIAGINADEIKKKTEKYFNGKTRHNIDEVIDELSKLVTFNPLPGGVCLYDYRRGNCANGDGCFFYNCPNFITEISFLPVLRKELELMNREMERTAALGYERQWQIQHSRFQCLEPLVRELEGKLSE